MSNINRHERAAPLAIDGRGVIGGMRVHSMHGQTFEKCWRVDRRLAGQPATSDTQAYVQEQSKALRKRCARENQGSPVFYSRTQAFNQGD